MSGNAVSMHTVVEHELSMEDLVALADPDPGTGQRISLYLPTHAKGRDVTQDPVRFRQLIKLAADEVDDPALLEPARALGSDHAFWNQGLAGLGVLIDHDRAMAIRLSEPVDELAVVSDRFHLKPLLLAVTQRVDFEVLALSRHAVRLVRGSSIGATEVEVEGLPAGMDEALRWDDRERSLQSHSAGRVGAGDVTAGFHGQGGRSDTRTTDVNRFLRVVDRAIVDQRRNSPLPLVLAGVDELVAAYRKVTRCDHVLDVHIAGNPDQVSADELAARARQHLEPLTADQERHARDAYLAGATATVDTIEQAVIAAAAGQVSSIFVPADITCWGRFRPGHALLLEHDARHPGDHDLADVAATETLRHGGTAFAVPASDIPGGGSAAATLRY